MKSSSSQRERHLRLGRMIASRSLSRKSKPSSHSMDILLNFMKVFSIFICRESLAFIQDKYNKETYQESWFCEVQQKFRIPIEVRMQTVVNKKYFSIRFYERFQVLKDEKRMQCLILLSVFYMNFVKDKRKRVSK